jgi:hypothetical protein
VSGIGGLQDTRSLEVDAFGASEVNGRWGVEADTRMAVVVVLPPGTSILAQNTTSTRRRD